MEKERSAEAAPASEVSGNMTSPGSSLSDLVRATASEGDDDEGDETRFRKLSELVDFKGPARLVKEAAKSSYAVQPNFKICSPKKRSSNLAQRRVDAFATNISVAMREQLREYKTHMRALAPFEAALANLSLEALVREGKPSQSAVLSDFDQLRRAVVREGREASAAAAKAQRKDEATRLAEEGIAHVQETFLSGAEALFALIEMVQRLRRLPAVSVHEPLIVLVGMPNVGKSSIVKAISSGTPEVNSYPFTTRRLLIGHVVEGVQRYQVMDTPGVLARANAERNAMEGLTLAAVELLPSAVVFVMDLSGTSGAQSSPNAQLAVREQVRAQFADRPWLDVRSKADLPLAEELDSPLPDGTLSISVQEGHNVDTLQAKMSALVAQLRESGVGAAADATGWEAKYVPGKRGY